MSVATETETKVKLKMPGLYNVMLLNDNYTPMDFVVQLLMELYGHSRSDALQLTMDVHEKGKGIAGTFTKEIASQKIKDTHKVAHAYGHPLKAVLEPA